MLDHNIEMLEEEFKKQIDFNMCNFNSKLLVYYLIPTLINYDLNLLKDVNKLKNMKIRNVLFQ